MSNSVQVSPTTRHHGGQNVMSTEAENLGFTPAIDRSDPGSTRFKSEGVDEVRSLNLDTYR